MVCNIFLTNHQVHAHSFTYPMQRRQINPTYKDSMIAVSRGITQQNRTVKEFCHIHNYECGMQRRLYWALWRPYGKKGELRK
jgi:hypothetical protein